MPGATLRRVRHGNRTPRPGEDATKVTDALQGVKDADLTILVQNHKEYDVQALAEAATRMLDTRGVTTDTETSHRL